jgi:hypothetical protein
MGKVLLSGSVLGRGQSRSVKSSNIDCLFTFSGLQQRDEFYRHLGGVLPAGLPVALAARL